MRSLFERAMGDGWEDLHPQVRSRYGLVAADGREAVATGTMTRLASTALASPLLRLAAVDDFLFPEGGVDVPFEMRIEPFVDRNGAEALFLARQFETDPPRTFVDTLRWNRARGCVTDLYGRRGHVVADLHLHAADGALALSLGAQWLRAGDRYFRLPRPVTVDARLRDAYDADGAQFRVAADVTNPLVGRVFAYEGRFDHTVRPAETGTVTDSARGDVALPGADA